MASTRKSRVSCFVVGLAVLVGGVLIAPLTAGAAPHIQTPAAPATPAAPQTSAQVLAKLGDLANSNERLTEQFNKAQIDLTKAQHDADGASKDAVAAKAELAVARKDLAQLLAAQYKGASFSHTAALLASNSGQNYLEKMQSLNFLALHQQDVAHEADHASKAAQQAQQRADALVSNALVKRNELATQRDSLTKEIDKQKQLLATLTAAERAQFQSVGAPSQAQVQQVTSAPVVAKSKGASVAVKAALSQLGKPYVWGAAGPDSYDCSGLTMWSWAQAGVSLPHQSAEQQGMGTPVDRSQLQPGDLVFFGSPAYHVGMYIGNGMMVHAPTSGDVVKISSLSYMSDYSGAVRIG